MSIPPESIRIGQCYLLETQHARRVCLVTDLMAGSSVRFEWRDALRVWRGVRLDEQRYRPPLLCAGSSS